MPKYAVKFNGTNATVKARYEDAESWPTTNVWPNGANQKYTSTANIEVGAVLPMSSPVPTLVESKLAND